MKLCISYLLKKIAWDFKIPGLGITLEINAPKEPLEQKTQTKELAEGILKFVKNISHKRGLNYNEIIKELKNIS